LDDTFPRYVIEGENIRCQTDGVELNALVSLAGVFMSGEDDYSWTVQVFSSDAALPGYDHEDSDARISTTRSPGGNDKWGTDTNETGDITFTITRGGTANLPKIRSVTLNVSESGDLTHSMGVGAYTGVTSGEADAGIDGVRLVFSSGKIAQGNFRLYGVE
jgi:hypothetical protein